MKGGFQRCILRCLDLEIRWVKVARNDYDIQNVEDYTVLLAQCGDG